MAGRTLRLFLALVMGALVLSACGGGGGESEEGGTVKCEGAALASSDLKLPSDFPIPAEAVLTTATKAGPSQIAERYYQADLESAYNEWKNALEAANYSILFDEIEDQDSEISYQSPDES